MSLCSSSHAVAHCPTGSPPKRRQLPNFETRPPKTNATEASPRKASDPKASADPQNTCHRYPFRPPATQIKKVVLCVDRTLINLVEKWFRTTPNLPQVS